MGNFRKAEVDYLYNKMRLTTSKVLKMIRVDEMSLSKPQSQVLQFPKQCIRGLTPKELQSFLRYVTGSSFTSSAEHQCYVSSAGWKLSLSVYSHLLSNN